MKSDEYCDLLYKKYKNLDPVERVALMHATLYCCYNLCWELFQDQRIIDLHTKRSNILKEFLIANLSGEKNEN